MGNQIRAPLIAAGGTTASTLAGQVAATVKAHLGCGPIAEEAYDALLPDPMQPVLVDPLLDTLAARIAAYGLGAPPPSPLAEQSVPAYLCATCWPQVTAAGRARILAAIAKLTCANAGAIADGDQDRHMLEMVRLDADGLEVIATQLHNDRLAVVAHQLKSMELDDAATIPGRCKALTAALSDLNINLQAHTN